MHKTSYFFPTQMLLLLSLMTSFSPVVQASHLSCSVALSAPMKTPSDQGLIDKMFTDKALRQAHELMTSLNLSKQTSDPKNRTQHRALVLMSSVFQPLGVFGQYITYQTAIQLQYTGDKSEAYTIQILSVAFVTFTKILLNQKYLTTIRQKFILKNISS